MRQTREAIERLPKWLKRVIAYAVAVTAIGGALHTLRTGCIQALPYAPATRKQLAAHKSWCEDEHNSLRGELKSVRPKLDDVLCAVDPDRAERRGIDCQQ